MIVWCFFKTNKRFALNDKPLTCMKQGNVSLTTKKLQSNKTVDAGEQLFQTSTCTSINFICFKIKESVLLLTISTNSDHYSRIQKRGGGLRGMKWGPYPWKIQISLIYIVKITQHVPRTPRCKLKYPSNPNPRKNVMDPRMTIIVVNLLSVSSSTGTIGGRRGYFTRSPSPGETEFLAFP